MRWRRRVVGAVALLAAVGMGTAAWRETRRPGEADVVGMPAADVPPLASIVTPPDGRPAAAPAAATSAVGASSAPESAGKPSGGTVEIPPEGLNVCGIGHVSADELRLWADNLAEVPGWIKAREADTQRRVDAGLAQMAARLAAGAEHQQVAARLIMGDAEGAAALAERSSDALAYQLALTACATTSRTAAPSCVRLNSRRWAALDPSDARPWLRLAGEAQRRGDASGAEAVLAEAAARPRLSRGGNLLETQVAPVAALVPDAAVRAQALVRVVGMDAAMLDADSFVALRQCNGEALKHPEPLRQCRTLARQLLAASDDLLEASAMQRLADRVGVPPGQQAHDAATLEAAAEAFQQKATDVVGFDCASMERMNDFSAQRAAQGELALGLSLLPPKPGR